MSHASKPQGPYTLWQDNGCEGWSFTDHRSYHAALLAERHTQSFVVQRPATTLLEDRIKIAARIAERVRRVIALGSEIDCTAIAHAAIDVMEGKDG